MDPHISEMEHEFSLGDGKLNVALRHPKGEERKLDICLKLYKSEDKVSSKIWKLSAYKCYLKPCIKMISPRERI